MAYMLRTREFAIGESLEKCASLVERVGQGEWNFILNNGSMLLASARADEHWLHLDAPLKNGTSRNQDAWQLLNMNRGLRGLSKLTFLPGEPTPRVRAEIPLDEDVDLQRRLPEACAGLKAAAGYLHGEKNEQPKGDSLTDSGGQECRDAAGLRNLCMESGWKFTERTATKLAVDLEVRSGFYQAIVEEQARGAVSIAVELTPDSAVFGEISKRALGTLLLRASSAVRLARGSVREGGEGAGFEVSFQTTPSAGELGHSLSALTVACELCGREAVAMQDEFVAKNYLAAQGLLMKLK
jgi:hypothetical protein